VTRVCVGDLVHFDHQGLQHTGVITEVSSDYINYFRVAHKGLQVFISRWSVRSVVPCKQCGYGRSAHTEEGKCLYGPGNWETP